MKQLRKYFILGLFSALCISVKAQDELRFTTSLGASAYLGDLIQGSPVFKQSSLAFSFGATYDFQSKIRGRLNVSLLSVRGDDKLSPRADLQARNLNFKSFIWEVSALGEYDFLDREAGFNIIPYAFTGLSLYHFNPTTIDDNGNKVNLHDIGTEGQYLPGGGHPAPYHRLGINIPIGLGVRYEISENVALGFEFNYRILFTDYLDDVSSSKYATQDLLNAGQTEAAALSYRADLTKFPSYNMDLPRGNPGSKDVFYSFQMTVSFKIPDLTIFGRGNPFGGRRTRGYY
ncbi:MAG: hypothetical protein C0459_08905 [Chitinophaga sp.]|jgi:Outer membrane protein beta-barrel domain|nr:hypothetical protein [Chitinophaga sp.]